MKQAVILAAGQGRRLNGSAEGHPKCLLRVGELTLIERQIAIMHAAGVNRIAVVIGHEADAVRSTVGHQCDFIANDRYAETNSLFSLWQCRHWVTGPFVLMNCDVLAHPDIYHRVMATNGSALAFDSTSGSDDEEMKVALRDGLVRGLSKTMSSEQVCGENVGILQFDAEGAERLFHEADRLVEDGRINDWAPAAVSRLAGRHSIRAVDIAGLPWTEIDFPEDLACADRDVLPCIDRGEWTAPSNGDGYDESRGRIATAPLAQACVEVRRR
jgi:choline kinase